MASVRLAGLQDSEAVWRVHTSAIRRLARTHYTGDQIEAWAGPRRPEHYAAAIEDARTYVAEEGGDVVGFGVLDVEAKVIEAVYVHPDHARKGIGAAILRTLEQRAKSEGIDTLRLNASLNVAPFYSRSGYREIDHLVHTLGDGVTEIACILMEKRLGD